MYPRQSIIIHILLLLFTGGIGNIIYYLYIKGQQRKFLADKGTKNTNNQNVTVNIDSSLLQQLTKNTDQT